ncbi:hypothetical protein EDB82DRAFT_555303 [Fusarium venenatum]|uniref:uncharacterized protein n=1 Tax=Fusarium venenatum TaxID=56646 RepID=UPI001DCE33B1|nr:hypothetical protein EDB82DRAFT_555303 [Fusarium venenatum]
MSFPTPAHGPLAKGEALVLWMQNRSSVFWTERSLPFPSKFRPTLPNRSVAIQNSHLLNLPMDCLRQIFLLLDIKSLVRFRQTAVAIKQKVDSLLEFRRLMKYAHDLLGPMSRRMGAEHIPLSELYYEMGNKNCIGFASPVFTRKVVLVAEMICLVELRTEQFSSITFVANAI